MPLTTIGTSTLLLIKTIYFCIIHSQDISVDIVEKKGLWVNIGQFLLDKIVFT